MILSELHRFESNVSTFYRLFYAHVTQIILECITDKKKIELLAQNMLQIWHNICQDYLFNSVVTKLNICDILKEYSTNEQFYHFMLLRKAVKK